MGLEKSINSSKMKKRKEKSEIKKILFANFLITLQPYYLCEIKFLAFLKWLIFKNICYFIYLFIYVSILTLLSFDFFLIR